eukprot:2802210-Prymnesium_polylepis.1
MPPSLCSRCNSQYALPTAPSKRVHVSFCSWSCQKSVCVRVPSQDECAFHANDDCPYEWCQEGK